MIKISIVGDLFPGGRLAYDPLICNQEVNDILSRCNIRVATLESAIGEDLDFDEEKMSNPNWRNIVYAPNKCINILSELHFDVVSLANNHVYDLGEKGLVNTISLLDDLGIAHCGAGMNLMEASKPAVVTYDNKTVAFLGYMVYFDGWRAPHPATSEHSGLNIFDLERAIEDIKMAKDKYDYVFILPHWGTEYSMYPTPVDVLYAHKLLAAGADGVIGSHAHQIQPLTTYKGKPIFYNLGNFIFPDFYFDTTRATCYPEDLNEMPQIPTTYSYERYPNEIKLRVWPKENRRGVLGMINIDPNNHIVAKAINITLNEDNVLQVDNDFSINKKMRKIKRYLDSPFYNIYYRFKHSFWGRHI